MSNITAVIPTSAIKSHPDTYHIDKAIESIRYHLPDSEIIITFDGIHPDFEHYKERYNEYKSRILWKCLHQWKNVLPMVIEEHGHQSEMMRMALEEIKTPLLLYVEHDCPLVTDRKIDWQECEDYIMSGKANTIRFNHEEKVLEPHKQFVLGKDGHFIKTIQWSQRPQLSSVVYYKDEVMRHFPEGKPTFIEDVFHSVVMQDYYENGMMGWYKHRLVIYNPKDKLGHKRSYHTDGREDDGKVGEGIQK